MGQLKEFPKIWEGPIAPLPLLGYATDSQIHKLLFPVFHKKFAKF